MEYTTGKYLTTQPIEQVPYSARYPDLQDWDDPPTCILWPKCRETLEHIKNNGTLPENHQSHDHLNKQVEVDVDRDTQQYVRQAFERIEEEQKQQGFEIVWFIVDGFVLYWDPVRSHTHSVECCLRTDSMAGDRQDARRQALLAGT